MIPVIYTYHDCCIGGGNGGAHLVMLKAYSRLCSQRSLLVDSGGHKVCQGSNLGGLPAKQVRYPLYYSSPQQILLETLLSSFLIKSQSLVQLCHPG